LIGYVVVMGVGYVMGTKAGRRRYEQIIGSYHALTSSPMAKAVIDKGRRSIANRIHPDQKMVTLTELEDGTTVMRPADPEDPGPR
jgi:CO/xanthine dehydrogenase Mo-binding subunit